MTTATQVLAIATGYLGVAEDPPHSNQTIIGRKFGWNGVPWCAESVSVWMREAHQPFKESASCSQLVAWYMDETNGRWLGNGGIGWVLPGDEFFLGRGGGDHTGLVQYVEGNDVVSIEGNWGDKVAEVRRPVTAFYGFGRPVYHDDPVDIPPTQPQPIERIDDMAVLQRGADKGGDFLLHNGKIVALGVFVPASVPRIDCTDDAQWKRMTTAYGTPIE